MGCGSTRSASTKAQPPQKKPVSSASPPPVSLSFDPLTSTRIVLKGSLSAKLLLSSGDTETEQFPVSSSRLYATDRYFSIVISSFTNFSQSNAKIFPKISYSLQSKRENGEVIASNEDYHGFSQTGLETSTPEVRIVLPLHSVEPKKLFFLRVSIKDAKSADSLQEISLFSMFLLTKTQRPAALKENVEKFATIDAVSLNSLTLDSVCVFKEEDEVQAPYAVEYGRKLMILLNNLRGFQKTAGDLVSPGCSLLTVDEEGAEVFFKENLFPEDNEYHEEDLSEFRVKIEVGGANFRPLRDYWLNIRIWDERGPGQLGIKLKYQGSKRVKEIVKVFEVSEEKSGEFCVKLKGDSGFLSSKFVFLRVSRENAEVFKNNLERLVEVELEWEEKFKEMQRDIVEMSNSNDGVERNKVSWRLVAITARN